MLGDLHAERYLTSYRVGCEARNLLELPSRRNPFQEPTDWCSPPSFKNMAHRSERPMRDRQWTSMAAGQATATLQS